jgi:two-component system response regulator PilR (NtrC family)
LAAICNSLLARIARDAGAPLLRLSDGAWTQLRAHTFPGNVRELENLLHRAVAMANGPEITIEDLGLPPLEDSPEDLSPAEITTAPEADALSTASPAFTLPSDLAHHLDDIERDLLTRALREHRNNRTAAGAALGLSLRQMRYRMARLGIQIQGETPDLQSKDFDAGGLP